MLWIFNMPESFVLVKAKAHPFGAKVMRSINLTMQQERQQNNLDQFRQLIRENESQKWS